MATRNGSTSPAEDSRETSGTAPPTGETVLQVCAAYVAGKEAEIKELKAQLAACQIELQCQKEARNKSLREHIERLEREPKMPRDLRQRAEGVSGMDLSTDAAGDASVGENLARGLEGVRIGGEHPVSCPSTDPVCSELLETDGVVTQLPNTHLEQLTQAHTESVVLPADSAAWKRPTVGGALAPDKLGKGNDSLGGIASKKQTTGNIISTEMMAWLSENLPLNDWKPFMRKLGLADNDIDTASYGHSGITEQRYQCLLFWRKRCPAAETTVAAVLGAMREKLLQQMARDFCKEFPQESSSSVQNEGKIISKPTKMFSSDLERFLDPFVDNFSALKKDLYNGPQLTPKQCVEIGYQSQDGNSRLDTVFEWWSAGYYEKGNSDSDLDKRLELQKILRNCGADVRGIFKEHVNQGGVIGPAFGDGVKLNELPYSSIENIEELLSQCEDVSNWKHLADWLSVRHPDVFRTVNKNKIRVWEADPNPYKGAQCVLQVWETTTQARVGVFYSWLVENGRKDIAKVLE